MSLEANFTAMAMSKALADEGLDGVVDICPGNASLLIRFDPDVVHPRQLEAVVRRIEADVDRRAPSRARHAHHRGAGLVQRPVDQRDR